MVVGSLFEWLVLELPHDQIIRSRIITLGVSVLLGGLYGRLRKISVYEACRAPPGSLFNWRTVSGDIAAFLLFQVPLYAIQLAFVGADTRQMVNGVFGIVGVGFVAGPGMGTLLAFSDRSQSLPSSAIAAEESAN